MSRRLGDGKHGHHEARGLGQVIDRSRQSFGKVNFGTPSAEVRLTLPSLPGTHTVSAAKNWALLATQSEFKRYGRDCVHLSGVFRGLLTFRICARSGTQESRIVPVTS
jgi:hypothetical protein